MFDSVFNSKYKLPGPVYLLEIVSYHGFLMKPLGLFNVGIFRLEKEFYRIMINKLTLQYEWNSVHSKCQLQFAMAKNTSNNRNFRYSIDKRWIHHCTSYESYWQFHWNSFGCIQFQFLHHIHVSHDTIHLGKMPIHLKFPPTWNHDPVPKCYKMNVQN